MYARLVEVEGVDPAKRDEVLATMRDRIIPTLKQVDGFAGFISLMDPENRRGRTVLLWETKEAAEEAEKELAPRREAIVRDAGGTIRSTDLYEAPIVEVVAGVRA